MLQFLMPLEPICNKKIVLTNKKCSFWKLSWGLNNRMFCKMTLFLFSNSALLTFSEVPSKNLFLHYMQKRCSIWLTFYLLYLSNTQNTALISWAPSIIWYKSDLLRTSTVRGVSILQNCLRTSYDYIWVGVPYDQRNKDFKAFSL